MNSQTKAPQEVLDILKEKEVGYYDIAFYAWPYTFGSTSGPRGGIGGQAMTTFTIFAWVCDDIGPTVFTCAGMYHFDDGPFSIMMPVPRWKKLPESKL